MKKLALIFLIICPLLLASHLSQATTKTLQINTADSKISFTSFAFFNDVSGTFTHWQGTLDFNAQTPTQSAIKVTIETKSINTENSMRDKHLRGKSFFYVEKFPQMTFQSKAIDKMEQPDTYQVSGLLTVRDISKKVSFPAQIKIAEDGHIWAKATLEINRRDFNINFHAPINPIKNQVRIDFEIKT